ncbi:MAG: hypothetical protein U0836_15060 [Pirellulales bacterium]
MAGFPLQATLNAPSVQLARQLNRLTLVKGKSQYWTNSGCVTRAGIVAQEVRHGVRRFHADTL